MTLVVAGHSMVNMMGGKSDYVEGLFAASDSYITQQNRVLVSGFKKVIEVPIRVNAPSFSNTWLNGYNGYKHDGAGFVAFAGSTLVAQHIINSIKNHLGNLFPTYRNDQYKIVMVCEKSQHLEQGHYDESMFTDRHFNNLLSAQLLSDIVSHSIQSVLNKAKKHDGMKNIFSAFQAEFIFGVKCPTDNNHYLYQYEITPDENEGAKVTKIEIPQGEVAVIGMKELFAVKANERFNEVIQSGGRTADEMHKFVLEAIEDQNSAGINAIGKPCGLYKYSHKELTLNKFHE